MAAEEAIAITFVGLAFLFLWFSTQEYIRRKHESLSLLLMFVGLMFVFSSLFSVAVMARSGGFFGVESIALSLMSITLWVFVFVLLYFMLQILVYWLRRVAKANEGGDDDE